MSSRIDCILVEDELLQMRVLKQHLQDFRRIKVVGEAHNLEKAFQLIVDLQPQAAIMDVRFNGGTIYDLFNRLKTAGLQIPVTILISSHKEEAVRAFNEYKEEAAFFILKRDLDQNLPPAIDRLLGMIRKKQTSQAELSLDESAVLLRSQGYLTRVEKNEVAYAEVRGPALIRLITDSGEYQLNCTLTKLLETYPGLNLFRINRKVAVAWHRIEQVATQERELKVNYKRRTISFLIGNEYFRDLIRQMGR